MGQCSIPTIIKSFVIFVNEMSTVPSLDKDFIKLIYFQKNFTFSFIILITSSFLEKLKDLGNFTNLQENKLFVYKFFIVYKDPLSSSSIDSPYLII